MQSNITPFHSISDSFYMRPNGIYLKQAKCGLLNTASIHAIRYWAQSPRTKSRVNIDKIKRIKGHWLEILLLGARTRNYNAYVCVTMNAICSPTKGVCCHTMQPMHAHSDRYVHDSTIIYVDKNRRLSLRMHGSSNWWDVLTFGALGLYQRISLSPVWGDCMVIAPLVSLATCWFPFRNFSWIPLEICDNISSDINCKKFNRWACFTRANTSKLIQNYILKLLGENIQCLLPASCILKWTLEF